MRQPEGPPPRRPGRPRRRRHRVVQAFFLQPIRQVHEPDRLHGPCEQLPRHRPLDLDQVRRRQPPEEPREHPPQQRRLPQHRQVHGLLIDPVFEVRTVLTDRLVPVQHDRVVQLLMDVREHPHLEARVPPLAPGECGDRGDQPRRRDQPAPDRKRPRPGREPIEQTCARTRAHRNLTAPSGSRSSAGRAPRTAADAPPSPHDRNSASAAPARSAASTSPARPRHRSARPAATPRAAS